MKNLNSGYGMAQVSGIPYTTGNVFVVAADGDANFQSIDELYRPDEGVAHRYSTMTTALAACTADKGDVIVTSPNFETALTVTELLAAETKGVRIVQANADPNGIVTVHRADGALAQSGDLSLFTITGLVEIVNIIGKVGTVIQTQANNTLLKINPTDGADVDICAALNISADAAKSFYSITGTASDALINTASGSFTKQATPVIANAGVLELECAASNTGTIKWIIQYQPLEPGARVFAA